MSDARRPACSALAMVACWSIAPDARADAANILAKAKERAGHFVATEAQLKDLETNAASLHDALSGSKESTNRLGPKTVAALADGLAQLKQDAHDAGVKAQEGADHCFEVFSLGAAVTDADLKRCTEGADLLDANLAQLARELKSTKAVIDAPASGSVAVDALLNARCATALCFDLPPEFGGKRNWLGIEPLVELPVGKTFSLGTGTLADYINNTGVRVDLAAGLRVWIFRDIVSLSVYLSQALATDVIRVQGIDAQLPASNLKRSFPGIGIGLLYDSLWISFDRDELRNGSQGQTDPHFAPNQLIASTWSITLGIQPITGTRTAIAAVNGKK